MFLMNKTTGRQEAKKPMLTKDPAERLLRENYWQYTHTHKYLHGCMNKFSVRSVHVQHLKSILAPKNKTYIFVLLTFSFSPVTVCSISEFFSLRLHTRCFLIPFRLCCSLPVYASEDFPWSVPFILNGITWNSHCWSFFHSPIRP